MDITQEQEMRAAEAAKHPEVRWLCGYCRRGACTDNKVNRRQCSCGNWMNWSTLVGV